MSTKQAGGARVVQQSFGPLFSQGQKEAGILNDIPKSIHWRSTYTLENFASPTDSASEVGWATRRKQPGPPFWATQ